MATKQQLESEIKELQAEFDAFRAEARLDEKHEVIPMDAITLVSVCKNRLEICGIVFLEGVEVCISGDRLGNEKLYSRICRALEIGILKEV